MDNTTQNKILFKLEQKIHMSNLELDVKMNKLRKYHQAQINALILENRNLYLRLNELEERKKKDKKPFWCIL